MGTDGAPHWGIPTSQREMGGELATSAAPGTSILPVREMENKKNHKTRHSMRILLIPRNCKTSCEVFSLVSVRKMLHEKTLATVSLGFSSCGMSNSSVSPVWWVMREMTSLLQWGLWFSSSQTGSLRPSWSSEKLLLEKLSPCNCDFAVRNHVHSGWGRGERDTAEDRSSRREEGGPIPTFQSSRSAAHSLWHLQGASGKHSKEDLYITVHLFSSLSFWQRRPYTVSLEMADALGVVESSPTTWSCNRKQSSWSNLHLRKVVYILVPLLAREKPH